jgi:hypothetical protein
MSQFSLTLRSANCHSRASVRRRRLPICVYWALPRQNASARRSVTEIRQESNSRFCSSSRSKAMPRAFVSTAGQTAFAALVSKMLNASRYLFRTRWIARVAARRSGPRTEGAGTRPVVVLAEEDNTSSCFEATWTSFCGRLPDATGATTWTAGGKTAGRTLVTSDGCWTVGSDDGRTVLAGDIWTVGSADGCAAGRV